MQDAEKIRLVSAWIDAFYTSRDDELLALAHPEVEVWPRSGMGLERCYAGLDGVRRWLADVPVRAPIDAYTIGELSDGRVLAEAELDGTRFVALFVIRDNLIGRVKMYMSDAELLQRLGEFAAPPVEIHTRRTGQGAEAS